MGPWGPLPEAELKVHRRLDRIKDDKIAATYARYISLRINVRPSQSIERWIPERWREHVRSRLNTPELLETLAEARTEHQWAMYDRTISKRTLYPRKRPISPGARGFDSRNQRYDSSQGQSLFFKLLPPELRAEVYRAVFGGRLIVDITATSSGFNGPPPSRQCTTFGGSIIYKTTGEVFIRGCFHSVKPTAPKWKPHILPLLQSCRKIYDEAIPILYGDMIFKSHNAYNSTDWSRFLLTPRLEMIREAHFKLQLGYPWGASCYDTALSDLLKLKGLQKLCILGNSGGMIDCDSNYCMIDEDLWEEKKERFLTAFKKFDYIKEVDIFLPIPKEILVRNGEEKLGHIRVHGLTEDEAAEKTPVMCACRYRPEKLRISHEGRSY